jgi:hypothetical protein
VTDSKHVTLAVIKMPAGLQVTRLGPNSDTRDKFKLISVHAKFEPSKSVRSRVIVGPYGVVRTYVGPSARKAGQKIRHFS